MTQKHRTPTTLDLATRIGRLTLGHIAALLVGGVTLLGLGHLTTGVHDVGHHFALVVFPTILVCAPILALTRGGIERYPQQSTRYAGRLIARLMGRATGVIVYQTARCARRIAGKAKGAYHACLARARARAR